MAVLVTLLAIVVALLGVLVAGLLRSHAQILRSLHGLGVDGPEARAEARPAADLAGITPAGDALSIAVVGAAHPTLIAFLTSSCSTCAEFWRALSTKKRLRVPGGARLVVVTKGAEAESPARLRTLIPPDVPVVMSSEAWEAYGASTAPYFAYVDGPSGAVVRAGAASTWDHVVSMMEQARGSRRSSFRST